MEKTIERKNLEKEAAKTWVQYGKVICKKFGFGEGNIIAYPLLEAVESSDDNLKKFIGYVCVKITELEKMK